MDLVVRLILRFILVPLGYLAAVLAGTCVIVFGAWRLQDVTPAASGDPATAMFGVVLAGPLLFVLLLAVFWLPASIGVLISETFALRSWIFHAGNGAASAWIGWNLFGDLDDSRIPINSPLAVIAAGLAGGFAYWAVAGFSAGFWRPVFRPPSPPAPRSWRDYQLLEPPRPRPPAALPPPSPAPSASPAPEATGQ